MNWDSIYDFIGFLANIATSAGIIILVKQLYVYNKQTKLSETDLTLRLEYQKREKSGEMAKEFSLILTDISFVLAVLNKNKTDKILCSNKCQKLEYFDVEELNGIFEDEKLDEIKAEIKKPNISLKKFLDYYDILYYDQKSIISAKDRKVLEKIKFKKHENEDNEEKKIENEVYDKVYRKLFIFFEDKRTHCLNTLEYIAMNFCTEIADAKIAYHSLHQLFLTFVRSNFFFIAIKNSKGGKDRFYIYLIELYGLWNEQFLNSKLVEEKKKQEILREKRAKISELVIDNEQKK